MLASGHARQVPGHLPRRRRSVGRRHERLHRRRVDDPGDLRGDVRRAPGVALHLADRRLRPRAPAAGSIRRPTPIRATCTTAGRAAFVGDQLRQPRDHRRRLRLSGDADRRRHIPLLVDAAGNVYAATRTYADGREALALTFAQASYLVSYARARLRARRLGDARAVRRRASHLRRPADRRSLSLQRHLHRRDLPDHQRRPAGLRELGEQQTRAAADRGLSLRLGGQRAGVAVDAGRSAHRPGGGAGLHVLLAQPHLGPRRARRPGLRRRAG